MYRVINEYLSKVNLDISNDIYEKIDIFLKSEENIEKYCINVSFKNYIVDIKLADFSVEEAAREFLRISDHMSYDYSSMHVRYNEGTRVRYRFVTCRENKSAFYMDIIFS